MTEFDYGGVMSRLYETDAEALGRALSVLGLSVRVGIMSYRPANICESIAVGAAKAGCRVTVYGEGRYGVGQFACRRDGLDVLAYVADECRVYLVGGYGFLSKKQISAVMTAMKSDIRAKKGGSIKRREIADEYREYVRGCIVSLDDCFIPFCTGGETEKEIAAVASSLGTETAVRSYGYTTSAGGRRAYYNDENGWVIGYWQLVLLCCDGRHNVCLPRRTPQGVTAFLRSRGVQVVLTDRENECFVDDAALLVLTAEKNLALTGMTMAEAHIRLPRIFAVSKYVITDRSPSVIGESGVRINYRGGSVAVLPDINGYRIYAEGVSSEIAEEICDQTEKRIR